MTVEEYMSAYIDICMGKTTPEEIKKERPLLTSPNLYMIFLPNDIELHSYKRRLARFSKYRGQFSIFRRSNLPTVPNKHQELLTKLIHEKINPLTNVWWFRE